MAIAHICMQCGLDLARIRARLEPIYRLPLVTCPRCGRHSVRRRHPMWQTYRTLLRVDAALTVLFVQTMLFVSLLIANLAGAIYVGNVLDGLIAREWLNSADVAMLVTFAIAVPIVTGTWLTVGLAHWNRFAAWCAYFSVVYAILGAVFLVHVFWVSLADLGALDWAVPLFHVMRPPRSLFESMESVGAGLLVLPAMMIVATSGVPLGRRLRRLGSFFRSRRWRWRRRGHRLGRIVV